MGFVKPGETEEQSNKAFTYIEFINSKEGYEYTLYDLFREVDPEEINKDIEAYVRYRIEFSRR